MSDGWDVCKEALAGGSLGNSRRAERFWAPPQYAPRKESPESVMYSKHRKTLMHTALLRLMESRGDQSSMLASNTFR